MKASIKFRDDQKALFRAKVPLCILGMRFQSGIVAGESKELALNLGTFFDSGPSLKMSYRPNDSLNPFSLVFKTGIGRLGSPISSPMTMSAEFNLIGNQNPTFFVHFKPQFGDFTVKKSQSSELVRTIKRKSNGAISDDDRSMELIDTPVLMKSVYSPGENGLFSGKQIAVLPSQSPEASLIGGLLGGTEASARTVLPVMNRAVVNFRWGLKFPDPAEEEEAAAMAVKGDRLGWISFQKFPLLVMNKIKVEHVVDHGSKHSNKVGPCLDIPRSDDAKETCLALMHQLEIIQAENRIVRKAIDDLKSEFDAGKSALPAAAAAATGVVDSGKNKEGERRVKASSGGKS